MKKTRLLLLACALFIAADMSAQVSAGGGIGMFKLLPQDGIEFDAMFGFNLSGKFDINENMAVGLDFGRYATSEGPLTFFISPITGTFEYRFMTDGFMPYAGAGLGMYRIGFRYDGESESDSYFGVAPTVGADYGLSDNLFLNANFKYNVIFTEDESSSAIGLNAGIRYMF